MKRFPGLHRLLVLLFLPLALLLTPSFSAAGGKTMVWDFEKSPEGSVPQGWRTAATNAKSLPVWRVIKRADAPSGSHVLAMLQPAVKGGLFGIGSVFNICYYPALSLKDPVISVKFRSVSGEEDRGGGIMWRVKNSGTYYVARFNPLEDNFRIYYVKEGKRVKIASAKVSLKPDRWHSMKIVQKGERFTCYLDGKPLLSGRDGHIEGAGGVGLWTKADAVTLFDDFMVKRAEEKE